MKLDRNINPDGRGKYALINLRKVSDEEFNELRESRRDKEPFALGSECLTLGDEKGEQFFVIKYKDQFAPAALRAYAADVREYASNQQGEDRRNFIEYAAEIEREAAISAAYQNKKLPS